MQPPSACNPPVTSRATSEGKLGNWNAKISLLPVLFGKRGACSKPVPVLPSLLTLPGRGGRALVFIPVTHPEGNKGAEGEVLRYKSHYEAGICFSNTFLTGILSLPSQTNEEEHGGKGVGGERTASEGSLLHGS